MRMIRTYHRLDVVDAERRLLYVNERAPGNLERMASTLTDWAKRLKDYLGDTGKGIVKGLMDGWNYSKLVDDHKQKEMASISDSLTLMPKSMLSVLESEFAKEERLTLEELAPLFQLDTWSRAFETPGIFDARVAPVQAMGSLREGPIGILRSLDVSRRRELFIDFFDALVPPAVGMPGEAKDPESNDAAEAYHTIVSNVADDSMTWEEAMSKDNRIKFLFGDSKRVSQAQTVIGGVLGRPDRTPTMESNEPAYLVARSALRQHYWTDGKRQSSTTGRPASLKEAISATKKAAEKKEPIILPAYGASPRLFDDMSRAIRAGTRGATVRDLQQKLPPSLLKGALATGVIGQEDIAEIEAVLGDRDAAVTRTARDAKDEFLKLSGVVKAERTKEGMDFAKTFASLSGFEKLALVAGGLYLAMQKPGLTVGAAVWYFGSKFLLNQKDPVNQTLAPKVKSISDYVSRMTRTATGGTVDPEHHQLSVDAATKRVDTMREYLTESMKRDVDDAVVGFSTLGDMRLRDIANAMVLGNDSGNYPPAATLNVTSESFKFLRQELAKKGVRSSSLQRFFMGGPDAEPELALGLPGGKTTASLLDSGSALMVVFYRIAARNPEHRDMVKRIEKFRELSDGRYESLPKGIGSSYDGVEINARQEFMRLVRKGMAMAPDTTLYQHVEQELVLGNLDRPFIDIDVDDGVPTVEGGVDRGRATVEGGGGRGTVTKEASKDRGMRTAGAGVDTGAATRESGADRGVPTRGAGTDRGAATAEATPDWGTAATDAVSGSAGTGTRESGVDRGSTTRRPSSAPGTRTSEASPDKGTR